MPHERLRLLAPHIQNSLKWSPAVGVYGLRQAGKSTLVQHLTSKFKGDYETFDSQALVAAAEQAPVQFCTRQRLLCLDEAQKVPGIFPAIKQIIGTKRKPGQFLLTGSIRFTLKKEIKESLTGRVVLHELLPFSLSEALQKPASFFLHNLFSALIKLEKKPEGGLDFLNSTLSRVKRGDIHRFMTTGGMPIPCFTRDKQKRGQWFQGYFETLVTRDLFLADSSLKEIPYRLASSFLYHLARMQGRSLNVKSLANDSSLRLPVAQKIIRALEMLSLIDFIPPDKQAKKSATKMRVEWKDIGLWNAIMKHHPDQLHQDKTALLLLIAQEFRSQINLMPESPSWHFYSSHDGAEIPIILKLGKLEIVFTVTGSESPDIYEYRALLNFVKSRPSSLAVILGPESASFAALNKNVFLIPYPLVF